MRYRHALCRGVCIYLVSQDHALTNSNKIHSFAICFWLALVLLRWQSVLTITEDQMIENVLFVRLFSLFAC